MTTTVIGRHNYLFAGADSGGELAAAMYSLIGSVVRTGSPRRCIPLTS